MKWTHLSLADNFIFDLPSTILKVFNETLIELDLSRNFLIEMTAFPMMKTLRILKLDDCNIMTIANDSFKLLPQLESLSMQRNRFTTLNPSLMTSSLKSLFLSGQTRDLELLSEMTVPDGVFETMQNLQVLNDKMYRIWGIGTIFEVFRRLLVRAVYSTQKDVLNKEGLNLFE